MTEAKKIIGFNFKNFWGARLKSSGKPDQNGRTTRSAINNGVLDFSAQGNRQVQALSAGIDKNIIIQYNNNMNEVKTNAEIQKEFQHKKKIEAIKHLGGKCINCGQDDPSLLLFVGNRKKVKGQIYNWLRQKKYPKGYFLRCVVCDKKLKN